MDAYRVLQVAPDCEDEVLHGANRALSRHTSGIRYRTEIYAILGKMAMGAA
ncbi:MAG TPA: hypothetical protein VMK30_05755 [Pleomorphomonadaceae bacterium]|nr:hypothetical protein [Pleomorphomonadaceae bacterium]